MATHLNDDIHSALSGSYDADNINDLLLSWLQANGATSNDLDDAWEEMLDNQGIAAGATSDRWFTLLGDLGYTGSLVDREKAFWEDGGTLGGSILGAGSTLFYDFRTVSTGSIASIDSDGSVSLTLSQGTGSAQPTGVDDMPLSLGSELLTNGDFTNWTGGDPDNWTLIFTEDASNYIEESPAGEAHIVSDGSLVGMYNYSMSSLAGNPVFGGIDVTAMPDGDISFGEIRTAGGDVDVDNLSTTGIYTKIWTAGGHEFGVKRNFGSGTVDATVDDAFLKEITSAGNGAYFDDTDIISGAVSNATLGLTGTNDVVTLFGKFFYFKDWSGDTFMGKGGMQGGATDRDFAMGVHTDGRLRVQISDGSTVDTNYGSTLSFGIHTIIAEWDLENNTTKVWLDDDTTLDIDTTAGGLMSFGDNNDFGFSDVNFAGGREEFYTAFGGMVNRALIAAERTEIMAA